MADLLLEEEHTATNEDKEELNDAIHPLMKSSHKKDFMEDSFRKPEPIEQAPILPLIRPKLITSGFEDIGDYCAKNPTISEL